MERKPLKQLPYSPKKGKIYEMYQKQIGSQALRDKLNELIIADCLQSKRQYSKWMSIVSRRVWIEWLKIFGFPENYQPQEEWLEEEGLK